MSRFGNLNDPFVIQQQQERSEGMARIVAELRALQAHCKDENGKLSLWTNGADTYVARDAAHARELMGKHLGFPYESDASPIEDWTQRMDTGPLTIVIEHDIADLTRETKTVDEWIAENGPGFLCSTEH